MMKRTSVFFAGLAASAMLIVPPAVGAQEVDDRFKGSQSLKARQKPEEMAATDRLNKEQAEAAANQIRENETNRTAAERAAREREATIARQEAEHRAEVARITREHEAAMERWRADVAACEAGDLKRCAAPDPGQ
ncbi:MAG: hypothetical protein ACXIT4_07125 [Erythrobacter sp.]